MAKFKISGGTELKGEVFVSGAKNQALKLIPLAILLDGPVSYKNVPNILDVNRQLEIFSHIGGKYEFEDGVLTLNSDRITSSDISTSISRKLRASLVYLGPLLSRFKKATIPYPGGCKIGSRSIDTHTQAFIDLGAKVTKKKDTLEITLDRPVNKVVKLKEQSVTATENIAMYAAGNDGILTIENCAIEPEITELLNIIERSGANVMGQGTRKVVIAGNKNLKLSCAKVMPDRIEAATFAIAFLATGGEGKISPFPKEHLGAFLDVLKECGALIRFENEDAYIKSVDRLKPFKIKTAPYPAFPTDLQSPMSLIAAKASGVSYINEAMYENRLLYLEELKKMGLKAKIINTHEAEITGPADLKPTTIRSLDLRSGITILIAGIMTRGETTIECAEVIDRGYENIEDKLASLGANIKRI